MPPCLSATNVTNGRLTLEQTLDASQLDALKQHLPQDAHDAYFSPILADWIPIPYVNLVITEAARVVGKLPEDFAVEMSRISVERTLKTVWRVLLRFTSDEALIARTPVFYQKTFNTGTLASEILTSGDARIVLNGWPDIPTMNVRTLQCGIETVLRVAGRKNVHMSHKRTAHGIDYRAAWSA